MCIFKTNIVTSIKCVKLFTPNFSIYKTIFWDSVSSIYTTTVMTKTFMPTAIISIFSRTLFKSLSEAPLIFLGSSHGPLQHLQSRYWLRTKEPERVIDIFLISVSNLLLLLTSVVKARKRSREHVSRRNFIVGLAITSR